MTTDWIDYVVDNIDGLLRSRDNEARALTALYDLVVEFDNGGLSQYLMNSSGDTWPDLRLAFELVGFKEGLQWMSEIEEIYGGPLPTDRDRRLDRIPELPGWDRGDDPFEEPGETLRHRLMPIIHRIAENLVTRLEMRARR